MVSPIEVDGKTLSYDKIIEEKNLPPYWHRKYMLTIQRWRRYYGIKARSNTNPMHEILLEKIALIYTKSQYYESPDFEEDTGLKIENPLYMGKYDSLIKQMIKLVEQMQKYTEAKPIGIKKKQSLKLTVNATAKDIKELGNDELNSAIRKIISGEDASFEEAGNGTAVEEGPESGQSAGSEELD